MMNQELLIDDLKRVIGTSLYKAAILHLTGEMLSAEQLADAVGTAPNNLSKYTNPLTGAAGYLSEFRRGRKRFFRRDEKLDMIGFETTEPFAGMIQKWKQQRDSQSDE